MLSDLANIGKTIDSIIAGTVEFLYSIVWAVFLVYRDPIRGSLRLHQARSISSTTLLFLGSAAVIAYISYGASAAKTLFNASSPSLIVYVAVVISLYVVSDICVHVLSAWCAPWGRRQGRARDCLRYCFGSMLLGWATLVPLIIHLDNIYISPVYFPNEFLGDLYLIIRVTVAVCFILSYPLFVALFLLGRRLRGTGPLGLIGVALLVVCTLLVVIATLQTPISSYVSASLMDEKSDEVPQPVVSGFSCSANSDANQIQISAAVFNPANVAIVLNSGALTAEIGPFNDYIDDPPTTVNFPTAGQPLIVIAPGAVSVVNFDAAIDGAISKALSKSPTCRVSDAAAQDPMEPRDVLGWKGQN